MLNIQKCAVIGCGNVGATVAYTIMQSGLFSEMVLIDIDEKRARGEEMDLNHGLPFLSPMQIYAGTYHDLSDCFLIIITAGANQEPGEKRLDLVQRNVKIFRSIVDNITAVNRECILLVISNPVDILTYVTLKLSHFPPAHVIGSGTVLDTARLKFLMGEHLGVDSRNIHAFIIGEHGDSELAVWSSANVSGIDLDEYCAITRGTDSINTLHGIYDYVRDSAYEIIEGKGATYYAIAQAALRIIQAIVRDENSILPVSTLVSGHYGLDDLCLGIPSVIGRTGIKRILDIPLNEIETTRLQTSAQTLQKILCNLPLDYSVV